MKSQRKCLKQDLIMLTVRAKYFCGPLLKVKFYWDTASPAVFCPNSGCFCPLGQSWVGAECMAPQSLPYFLSGPFAASALCSGRSCLGSRSQRQAFERRRPHSAFVCSADSGLVKGVPGHRCVTISDSFRYSRGPHRGPGHATLCNRE